MLAASLFPTLALLTLLTSPASGYKFYNHTCAIQAPVLSCSNTSVVDTCCTPTEGLVLVTQFWNTYTGAEKNGSVLPKDSWTIHGLWPDRCDGTYGQYCDLSRQYDPRPSPNTTTAKPDGTPVPAWKGGDVISPLLNKLGKYDLLAFMNKYWIAQGSPNWDFWQHEFSKHATCFSTFDVGYNNTPNCYGPSYVNSTEASIVDFVETAVKANLQYPTYKWLNNAGIKPSNATGYNLTALQGALTNASGAVPYLGCSGPTRTVLSEVWYYTHSLGRPQDVNLKPVDQTTTSNCNKTMPIWYYERTSGSQM